MVREVQTQFLWHRSFPYLCWCQVNFSSLDASKFISSSVMKWLILPPRLCFRSLTDSSDSFFFLGVFYFLFQDVGIGRSNFSGVTQPGLLVQCVWLWNVPCLLLMARPSHATRFNGAKSPTDHGTNTKAWGPNHVWECCCIIWLNCRYPLLAQFHPCKIRICSV